MMGSNGKICIDSIIYDDQKMEWYLEDVGKRITRERTKQNLSISRLAELANLSVGCISKIEVAQCSISLKTLIKISLALNVPIGTLLEPEDVMGEGATVEGLSIEHGRMSIHVERFEQITRGAADEAVDFILNMAEDVIGLMQNRK